MRARKLHKSTPNDVSRSNSSDPYLARVCGLFVRDKSDLALVDLCNKKIQSKVRDNSKDHQIDSTLFMASLGTKTLVEDNSENSEDFKNKIRMWKARKGNIIVIDFKNRTRFIRINLDDSLGISLTLQVKGLDVAHQRTAIKFYK